MYTFKSITDLESMSLLRAAGLLWWRSRNSPTYTLLSAEDFDYREWHERWVSGGMTPSEEGRFCWPDGYWGQFAIRGEE